MGNSGWGPGASHGPSATTSCSVPAAKRMEEPSLAPCHYLLFCASRTAAGRKPLAFTTTSCSVPAAKRLDGSGWEAAPGLPPLPLVLCQPRSGWKAAPGLHHYLLFGASRAAAGRQAPGLQPLPLVRCQPHSGWESSPWLPATTSCSVPAA